MSNMPKISPEAIAEELQRLQVRGLVPRTLRAMEVGEVWDLPDGVTMVNVRTVANKLTRDFGWIFRTRWISGGPDACKNVTRLR